MFIYIVFLLHDFHKYELLFLFLTIFSFQFHFFICFFYSYSVMFSFLEPIFDGPKGNPCIPSPCGPNSQCKVVGEAPACSCLPNYIGVAPNCRPECSINAECPGNLACQNEKCVDPCPGSCGFNAECSVGYHVALCNCVPGYTGDPFSGCSRIECKFLVDYGNCAKVYKEWINAEKNVFLDVSEPPPNPCNPSPCGANAHCKERNGVGSCSCLPEYFGDPYTGCRPECVSNSDCDRNKACTNNRCKDPCPGTCGINAECRTVNHSPTCTCISGYTGNPLVRCEIEGKFLIFLLMVLPLIRMIIMLIYIGFYLIC